MDMIEKVAIKAMLACHEQESLCGPFVHPMERWVDDPVFRLYWRHIAEGAIEAMREPSTEMVKAAYAAGEPYEQAWPDIEWRAMIDAALTSSEK
jgi:hypothetical protein